MPIALVEIDEKDIEGLKCPFLLYGVYKKNASPKLKAAYLTMGELRKQMSEQHKIMESLQEYDDE